MDEQKTASFLDKVDFSCQRCSDCCRIDPGTIMLTKKDAERIAAHLKMTLKDFLKECCYNIKTGSKKLVSIKEKSNYDCLFWEKGCKIYSVRPIQCRTYPFWPSIVASRYAWNSETKRCPGMDKKGNLTLKDKLKFYNQEKDAVYLEYEI
jgi:uncharacterized protein